MNEFEVRKTVAAKPQTVFDVFTDHRGYADLVGLIRHSELEQEGEPAPNGVGAIRVLRMPGATVREQVTEFDRPDHYSYRLLSGAPVDRFVATVTFRPKEEGGTELTYSVSADPSLRLAKPIINEVAKKAIRTFTDAAAAKAE
ncbi:SRPBCC family protein [Streptomyces sp. NBC_01233]|uniref:SRPBCC family protein n=1 Tax=Streptomyces sp. NBC_01233 TaxID=2903787 RepID=UPI002E0F8C2C|nr:SRPBCC family protein [Streptomyces sp. NBC_01233]